MKRTIAACLVIWGLGIGGIQANEAHQELFPRSDFIKLQVYFWTKVFTEADYDHGFLHDNELILPVYEKVSVKGLNQNAAQNKIDAHREFWKSHLNKLADALENATPLSRSQEQLLNKFYTGITPAHLRQASERIRFQRGLSDKFQQGIARSGAYMPYIRRVLRHYNVPQQLAYLPHVESSFMSHSRSKSGAQGMWQFMRGTARIFMKVNHLVDERRDPFSSTVAAAKLLRRNHDRLGHWPLAITAYNHGANGVAKISKALQTEDLSVMIRHYQSRRFSFASKNFYAEFLAAWDVAENAEKYFGSIPREPELRFREVQLPKPYMLADLAKRLNYRPEEVVAMNPALSQSVVFGWVPIPDYYKVRIPDKPGILLTRLQSQDNLLPTNHLDRLQTDDEEKRYSYLTAKAKFSRLTVKRGDTLYGIAKRFGIPASRIAKANNMSLHSTIHPGQTLILPSPTATASNDQSSANLLTQNTHAQEQKSLARNRVVTVRRGDTLYAIAKRNGIHLNELISQNGLDHSSKIYPGQKLRINF